MKPGFILRIISKKIEGGGSMRDKKNSVDYITILKFSYNY
jgi:hypothetical protein